MSVEIDFKKLKKIAKEVIVKKQNEEKWRKTQEINEQNRINDEAKTKAKNVLAMIPIALEESVEDATQTPNGIQIVAMIPLVFERIYNVTDKEGSLDLQDTATLSAIENELKETTIPNVNIEISHRTIYVQQHFMRLSRIVEGPCKHYFLKVTATLPK